MKRTVILMIIAVFVLSVMGLAKAPAKGKAKVKKPVVSDQLLIKKAVLAYDDARAKKKTPLAKVKFGPIKIESGWATTFYNKLNSKGKVIITTGDQEMQVQYLLKKKGGKWQVVTQYVESYIDSQSCKEIGLTKGIAKKLGITSD